MDKKNQILMSVLGVFALVIVTVGVSYAFFSYSRVGETTNTITSGDIQFSYTEGAEAKLENAFPVVDSIGAAETATDKVYTFTVAGYQTGDAELKYNVTLLANNDGVAKAFTNDQIKISLKNTTSGTYAVGSASTGLKLSELTAASGTNEFAAATSTGSCVVVSGADAVQAGEDYELRMWISSDVDYSNTELTDDTTDAENDAQTSVGKFNGYSYSLKVKVDAKGTNLYGTTGTGA